MSTDPPAPSSGVRALYARLRHRWVVSLVGIVALLVAAGLGLAGWLSGGHDSGEPGADFATRDVINRVGGYRMTVPRDWQSTIRDTETQVSAPGRRVIVTIGMGPSTPLPQAGATFYQQVQARYSDAEILGVEARRIGGRPARVFAGLGTNSQGSRVRFLAITVAQEPAHYVIAVRAGADSDPARILPRVNKVVGTFQPLRA